MQTCTLELLSIVGVTGSRRLCGLWQVVSKSGGVGSLAICSFYRRDVHIIVDDPNIANTRERLRRGKNCMSLYIVL